MGTILEILQRIERRIEALLLFLWGIIGEAVAWNQDEHALPQRLIRIGQIVLAVMVFLLVLCAGGFVANNLLLKVIPASLMAMVFYVFITIFQWVPRRFAKEQDGIAMPWATWQTMSKEDRKEWKEEYSRDYALSVAVRGINGWLFWIVGILDLFILVEPWRSKNQLLVFGLLFLFWSINHFFRFLGTLRIVIKAIFAVILILLFLVRFGMETNNELALRIASGMGLAQSKSQIKRVAQDVVAKENRQEADLIPQQMLYEVVEGAVLVDRDGNVKTVAHNNLCVWVPQEQLLTDGQPFQPKGVFGVYRQAYLPKPGLSVERPMFKRDMGLEAWVNAMDLSRQVRLRPEPQIKKTGGAAVTSHANNPDDQSGIKSFLAAGGKIRWGSFFAVAALMLFGYWAAGKWLKVKHQTLSTVCRVAAIILICLAAWNYVISPFGQAALAGESSRQKVLTPPVKLTGQSNQWVATSTITTSAAELAQGKIVNGGLTLRWPKNAVLTSLTPTNSSIFPCGNNYVDDNGLVQFRKPTALFEFEAPAFALVAQAQGETGFVSWPSPWGNPLFGRVRFGTGSPQANDVVMPLFKLPEASQVILKINAPLPGQCGSLTWDSTPIQLEVVESR